MKKIDKTMVLLNDMAVAVAECGETFSISSLSTTEEVIKFAERIKGYEKKCDNILHETMVELHSSFITPIDQEDIIILSEKLDDIVDQMEEIASYFEMSNFTNEDKFVKEFRKFIGLATKELALAIDALVNKKLVVIKEQVLKVKTNEEGSDATVRKAIHELFASNKDAIEIIKLKDIYEMLENTVDATEKVAKTLDIIVMKNL